MIDLVYGRDILLSLDRGQGPSTLVKERLRRLGISVTGRRRRGYGQRSVAVRPPEVAETSGAYRFAAVGAIPRFNVSDVSRLH